MTRVGDVLSLIEQIAPARWAYPNDKVGLHVGDASAEVKSAVVSLDHSAAAIRACQSRGAGLLVTHHPLIWEPLKSLTDSGHVERAVADLVRNDVALIAAHTNWDCAPGGVNDVLAAKLGLTDVTTFGSSAPTDGRKIVVFCPEAAAEKLIDAMAEAGAGAIGAYRRCAFRTSGAGTFEATPGAKPRAGLPNARNEIPEVRLEMELPASATAAVTAAMLAAHPYEEPAYDVLVQASRTGQQIGRKGRLPSPLRVGELQRHIDGALATRSLAWVGSDEPIEWVAVVGGAADEEWRNALEAGCQALVTGEVKQHVALEAAEFGIAMFSAGHFATEHPGVVALTTKLRQALPDVSWHVFEPEPGKDGRPL